MSSTVRPELDVVIARHVHNLERRVDGLEAAVGELRSILNAINRTAIDAARLDDLRERVLALERRR